MARVAVFILLAACGSPSMSGIDAPAIGDGAPATDSRLASGDGARADAPLSGKRTVFVIPFENQDSTMIYGNTSDAPYLNGLITGSAAIAAHATNFMDELAISLPSEPHYIWMEAGTNTFADTTFSTDDAPSGSNSTASTDHLATQITAAGKTWTAYQEGLTTGTCPTADNGTFAVRHEPFVFFHDVSGNPPGQDAASCGAHFKAFSDLATDLANDAVPDYAFITPNLCDDMHGDPVGCFDEFSSTDDAVQAGDTWLQTNLPPLIAYTHTHDATIVLTWDEGDSTRKIPFMLIGDHVVVGAAAGSYTHSSQLKTVEELLALPVLPKVSAATDLSAMFTPGYL